MSRVHPAARYRRFLLTLTLVMTGLALPWMATTGAAPRVAEWTSAWRDRDIRIDGHDEEWRDLMRPVDGQKFSVAVLNDAAAVFFCLVSNERVTSTQISRQGLVLWFSRPDDKKHGFGVHFPLEGVRTPMRPDSAPGQEPPDEAPGTGQQALAILGPGKQDSTKMPMDQAGGIVARMGVRGDLLVYEIKVPLKSSAPGPYGLNVEPGGSTRLEISTPEWRGAVPGVRGPGGIRIGGGIGSRGMMYPPVDAALLRPLELATTLRLATAPAGR